MLDNFPSYLDKYPYHISMLSQSDNKTVSTIAKNLLQNLNLYLHNTISFEIFKKQTEITVLETDIQDLKSLNYMRSKLIQLVSKQGI